MGAVKRVIDVLYPVIGGRPGAPDDSNVVELEVAQQVPDIRGVSILVASASGSA